MIGRFPYVLPWAAIATCVIAGCSPGEPDGRAADAGVEPVSVTVFTDDVELFMEYPRLIRGREARFLAHVTVLATGEPVRSGSVTLEAIGPDEAAVTLRAERPARDGLFIPVGSFESPGMYEARIVVESEQVNATIPLPGLAVYADEQRARAAARAAGKGPAHAIGFLLEQQWKIGMLTEPATHRTLVNRLLVPGRIVAAAGGTAVVSSPVAGRLVPLSGELPRIGKRVDAGQVLAYIEPPLRASEVAQLTANQAWIKTLQMELLMRRLDLETKLLEVEQELPQATARLEFAQGTYNRIAKLREKGLGTEQQYEEEQRNLRVAQIDYESAVALKESYDSVAWRLDQLRTLGQSSEVTTAADHAAIHHLPLIAPIAGEIVSVDHIEGEHVEAQGEVYRIVETDRVWLLADVSEFDLAAVVEDLGLGAVMTLPAYPGRQFDVTSDAGGRLVNVGRVVDPSSRTIAVRYELPNPDGLLRIGMLADVFLETKQVTDAIAIPEQAVVMDNGQPTAFVLLGGESFQRRELTLGVRDNGYVEIIDGIESGERVVTKGAYFVKLASQSPETFGAGHAH